MAEKQTVNIGCSLPSVGIILTIIFVVFKLTGHLTWSWIWILSPLWISIGLSISILLLFVFIAVVFSLGVGLLAYFNDR